MAVSESRKTGDSAGIRTRVTAVKGRCLRPLDHRATSTDLRRDRKMVGVKGLEPPAPCSQSTCATNCATPRDFVAVRATYGIILQNPENVNTFFQKNIFLLHVLLHTAESVSSWAMRQSAGCGTERPGQRSVASAG